MESSVADRFFEQALNASRVPRSKSEKIRPANLNSLCEILKRADYEFIEIEEHLLLPGLTLLRGD